MAAQAIVRPPSAMAHALPRQRPSRLPLTSHRNHVFIVGVWATVRNYSNVIENIPSARADSTGDGPCDVFDKSGRRRPAGIASLEKIIGGYHKQIAVTRAPLLKLPLRPRRRYHMVIQQADLTPDSSHLSIRGQKKMANTAWAALY